MVKQDTAFIHRDSTSTRRLERTVSPLTPNNIRSISTGHNPIEAELERMVITEDLLMEIVSIIVQHPLNPSIHW
jgi:hypothetical protein